MDIRPRFPVSPQASDRGFSIIEMLVATLVLMVVSGVAMKGVMDMSRIGDMVSNRTDMHSGVRNATELLAQEVGQAGRVTLPTPVSLSAAAAIGDTTMTVSSATNMFPGEQLTVDAGASQETVRIAAIAGNVLTLEAGFLKTHADPGVPVVVLGGFQSGVVPDSMANGSTDSVLKIYGDILGDGSMVYVEYRCDVNAGRLYRNMMPFDAGVKLAPTVDQILIDNVIANPDGLPCFRYQRKTASGLDYIVDVAITLTVRSQHRDPSTGQFHTESKALLNVSPRNVFNVWQLAGMSVTNRIQPMPATVAALLED